MIASISVHCPVVFIQIQIRQNWGSDFEDFKYQGNDNGFKHVPGECQHI